MNHKIAYTVVVMLGLALIGAAAYLWQQAHETPAAVPAAAAPPAAPASASTPAAAAAPAPAQRYPIDAPPAAAAASGPFDVDGAVAELFGRETVRTLFRLDDFAQRIVATVDNLGRAQAPARLWPVKPVPGAFSVQAGAGTTVIDADNGLRYTPYVLLLESVDLEQLMALYRRLYPMLQQAYADLGFPQRHFNDRLVEVIDQLLATPEIDAPLAVHLPAIDPALKPARPWVLYEFDAAELQTLAAGQKMLLRMGPVNERRVKARLAQLRRLLTAGAPPR